jgi:hypothetical protein
MKDQQQQLSLVWYYLPSRMTSSRHMEESESDWCVGLSPGAGSKEVQCSKVKLFYEHWGSVMQQWLVQPVAHEDLLEQHDQQQNSLQTALAPPGYGALLIG